MSDQPPEAHNEEAQQPRVSPGGLVTVAYLKARLDEGADHLGIFLPLVLDVISGLPNKYFSAAEVQEAIASQQLIVMPQDTINTLLRRAANHRLLTREAGRFRVADGADLSQAALKHAKAAVETDQLRLGEALATYAASRGRPRIPPEEALDLVLTFAEDHQVSLLLGAPPERESRRLPLVESDLIAQFLTGVVANDPALANTLNAILEGLVLYRAAFLPDLADVSRRFTNVTAVFDTGVVRQALGYEGIAPRLTLRETIDLLSTSGVACVVLDKSVQEIRRILRFYQDRLASTRGRLSIRPSDMARHFLTERYGPSDVQEMSALLDDEIVSAGFTIVPTPRHVAAFTHDEQKLAQRLVDPRTRDTTEPRIEHDVDCVAAVLTMRRGRRSSRIEDSGAVFVTSSRLVIENVRRWWEEDEGEFSFPPVVHIRALANLAWLKRPRTTGDLQLRQLVTLCSTAMKPSAGTWTRFLTHLDGLTRSNRLTEDQATAVIVSAIADRILRDAEDEAGDQDIDAATLDEVVERVIADYSSAAEQRLAVERQASEAQLSEAEAAYLAELERVTADAATRQAQAQAEAINVSEELRRRDLAIDARARKWASIVGGAVYWPLVVAVVIAAGFVLLKLTVDESWVGAVVAVAVLIFTGLEVFGAFSQVKQVRASAELRLHRRFRTFLGG